MPTAMKLSRNELHRCRSAKLIAARLYPVLRHG